MYRRSRMYVPCGGPLGCFSATYRQSKKDLKAEMRRTGVEQWTLESVTGSGGFPGVVIRWRKDGVDYAVACDRYETKRSNLREAYLWIRETRKRADRPVETGEDEFAAARLPAADDAIAASEPPHEVLGVDPDAPSEVVRGAFRALAKEAHPDNGGSVEEFERIKAAKEAMLDD